VVKKSAPVVKKSAPVVKKSAPVVKKSAHVVKKSAPVVKKSAPVVKKSAPVVKKSAPVVKKAAPVVKKSPHAASWKKIHELSPAQKHVFDQLEGDHESIYEEEYGKNKPPTKGQVMQLVKKSAPVQPVAKKSAPVQPVAKKSAPVVKKSPELSPAQQQMFDEMEGSHKGTPKPPSAQRIGDLTPEQKREFYKMESETDTKTDTKKLTAQYQADHDACASDCASVASQQKIEGNAGSPSALLQALMNKLSEGSCDCEAEGPDSKPKDIWRPVKSSELLEQPIQSEGYDLSLWNSA